MNTAIPIWQILAFLGVFLVVTSAWSWFRDQYEVAGGRHFGFRLWRRWYGTRAWVCFKADADLDDPAWFQVIAWDDETEVPWVLIGRPDDEDLPPCWCPVTDLAPFAVRRLRPHLARFGRILLPQLYVWLPLRQPAGYAEADA